MKPYPEKPFTDWKQQGQGQYNRPFPLLFDDTLTQLGKMNLLMKLFELLQENFISMQEYMDAVTQFIESEYDENEAIFQDLKADVETYSERIDNANADSTEALNIASSLHESIMTAIDMITDIVTNTGDTNTEVIQARHNVQTGDSYDTLVSRLDAEYNRQQESLAKKANHDDVMTQLAQIVSASPTEVFASVDALRDKYPNGTTGVMIVENDWFYYQTTSGEWTRGGVFIHSPSTDFEAVNLAASNTSQNGADEWLNTIAYYDYLTVNDKVLTGTVVQKSSAARIEKAMTSNSIAGHLYYIKAEILPKYNTVTYFTYGGSDSQNIGTLIPNQWNTISQIKLATESVNNPIRLYHRTDTNYVNGDEVSFKNFVMIDLTATFGAGNEPDARMMDRLMQRFDNMFFAGARSPLFTNSQLTTRIEHVLNEVRGVYTENTTLVYQNERLTSQEEYRNGLLYKRTSLNYDTNGLLTNVTETLKDVRLVTSLVYANGVLQQVTKTTERGGL